MPSRKRSPRWLYETGRIYERKGGKCFSKKFQISVVSGNHYGHNSWSQCWIQINLPRVGEWLEIYEKPYMCTAVKKWPAPSWLVSSVGRALHLYRRGQGFKSLRALIFFRSHFSTTGSVVFIAARIAYISFLHRRLHSANLLLSKIQALLTNEIYYRIKG